MIRKSYFKDDEIRCIRLVQDQIFELLWKCYQKLGYEGLHISKWALWCERIHTGWDYDCSTNQITFFAYRTSASDWEIAQLIRSYQSSIINSFYERDPPHQFNRIWFPANREECKHQYSSRTALCFSVGEIRFLRVNFHAMREMITEYFMERGDKLFGVVKKQQDDLVYSFYLPENMEELAVCCSKFELAANKKYANAFEVSRRTQQPCRADEIWI